MNNKGALQYYLQGLVWYRTIKNATKSEEYLLQILCYHSVCHLLINNLSIIKKLKRRKHYKVHFFKNLHPKFACFFKVFRFKSCLSLSFLNIMLEIGIRF